MSQILLDEAVEDHQLRKRVFAAVPQEQLTAQVAVMNEWVAGDKEDLFQGIVRRFSFLRRFSPALVKALDFTRDADGVSAPCLDGLLLLRALNADHKRKLPEMTPTAFLSERQMALVKDDQGQLDKRRWECALLVTVRDEIKAGNLAVQHSKRFGRFDDFFMPDAAWTQIREAFFRRSGLPQQPDQVAAFLRTRLGQAYDRFLESAPDNSYAAVDENGWHLSTDPSEKWVGAPSRPGRPDPGYPLGLRAVVSNGPVLRVLGDRPHHGLRGAQAAGRLHRPKSLLPNQSRSGARFQDRIHPALHGPTAAANPDPSGIAQNRATARPGPARNLVLLWASRPN